MMTFVGNKVITAEMLVAVTYSFQRHSMLHAQTDQTFFLTGETLLTSLVGSNSVSDGSKAIKRYNIFR